MKATGEFDDWIPWGFQVRKARRPRRDVPPWANSDSALKERILKAAQRRYRIAYLYWRVGWNSREVAEELGLTVDGVKSVLQRLKNGAEK